MPHGLEKHITKKRGLSVDTDGQRGAARCAIVSGDPFECGDLVRAE